ncbi:hypothetical protein ARMSODRAFT_871465, partial [Armillaria solidipes]
SPENSSITAAFSHAQGKGTVTYSHCQHTKPQACLWPFSIAKDRGFHCLMKTGRLECYIPHPMTISHDVKTVFAKSRNHIAKMLQTYSGCLSFVTDAWMSPNHHPYVAITVHFKHNGEPVSLLLDFMEVAKSHTGENLAAVF